MAKSTATPATPAPEMRDDVAELLGLKESANTAGASHIKYLVVNTDEVDNNGNEIPAKTFHINGTDLYSKTIKFRPLDMYNRIIKTVQNKDKKWEVVNETIYYKREQPIDKAGGIACGRIINGPLLKQMTDSEKELNRKKATFYGYLFGFVEFPGEEPVLVEWRLPGGKAWQVGDALKVLSDAGKMNNFSIDLTLKPVKGSVHPELEVLPDVTNRYTLDEKAIEGAGHVLDHVSKRNAWISEQHRAALMQKSGKAQDKALLASLDASDEEDEDEIPFD